MFEKEAEEWAKENMDCVKTENCLNQDCNYFSDEERIIAKSAFEEGAEFGYNKANEWHNLNKNYKDLPNEGEWVEGLYIWYYMDKPYWDVFKVRWYYEIGELEEKLVRWYSYDENNPYENKIDEPDYWRKITLPMRNEYDRNY